MKIALSFLIALACWASLLTEPAHSELRRTTGKFSGIYHHDRWGVGRFNSDLVAPKLHERLKDHEGKHIQIDVKKSLRWSNPGAVYLEELGDISELPAPKLRIAIRARPEPCPSKRTCLLVKLINTGDEPIDLSLHSLVLTRCFSAREVVEGNQLSKYFPGYTRRQLSVRRGRAYQGWGPGQGNSPINHMYSRAVISSGTSISIAPKQAFPIIPRPIQLSSDGEVAVRLRNSGGAPVAAWFKTEELKAPEASDKRGSFFFSDIGVTKLATSTYSLRMKLCVHGHADRFVVAAPSKLQSSTDKRFRIAGKLFIAEENPRPIGAVIQPLGEYERRSKLMAVPPGGLPVEFSLKSTLVHKRYRYEVLAASGLESVSFEVPNFEELLDLED